MLDKLTHASFEPYLHHSFRIHAQEVDPVVVELISVTTLPEGSPGASPRERRTPFSLVFRDVNRDKSLHQAIYTVEHPDMGTLGIFLVPIGPDEHGMLYEAVFN